MTRTRPPRTTRTSRATRALGGLAVVLLTSLALSACAGGGSDGGGGEAAGSADLSQEDSDSGGSVAAPEAPGVADTASRDEPVQAQPTRALVRTGTIALRAEDVGRARFDVQKVVDAAGGEIGEESTSADADGDAEYARLVVRVPSARFAQTMTDLEGVADLISTDTSTEDVTTEVIDTDVRVKLQRRSIDRLSALLERAGNLGEIVRLEQELARREADLASLEQQQDYLDDQTSFSTITVSLERPAGKEREKKDDTDDAGFLAGLTAGWDALGTATTGVLTVTGAVLPFALLLLVLGSPALLVLRRRRAPAGPTTPAGPGSSARTPSGA